MIQENCNLKTTTLFHLLVCVGGPSSKKTGKKILGISVKKPKWDSCKVKVEDVGCVTKCKAKKVYMKGKATKKKVTTEVSWCPSAVSFHEINHIIDI